MKRWAAVLVLAAGCASPPPETPEKPKKEPTDAAKALATLVEKANALTSFRAFYEITDESTKETAVIEIAYRAPDRAKVIYSGVSQTYFDGGFGYVYSEAGPRPLYFALPYIDELKRTQESYAETLKLAEKLLARAGDPGVPPRKAEIVFGLGGWETLTNVRKLRTLLAYSTAPTRLGWLKAIHAETFSMERKDGRTYFRRDSDGRFQSAMEYVIDDNGFIERLRVIPVSPGTAIHPGFTLRLRSLTVNEPPDDAAFIRPDPTGYQDRSEDGIVRLRATLADGFQRGLLEMIVRRFEEEWPALGDDRRAEIQAVIESVFKVDLPRTYEPATMVRMLTEGLDRTLQQYRRDREKAPNPRQMTQYTIEKFKIGRETYIAKANEMDERIRADYRKFLDIAFHEIGRPITTPVREGLALLWEKALSAQIDSQIRKPFQTAFDERLKILEGDLK